MIGGDFTYLWYSLKIWSRFLPHFQRQTYLPPLRERAPEARCEPTHPTNQEGPPTGPVCAGVSPWWVVERRLDDGSFPLRLRSGVDTFVAFTPLPSTWFIPSTLLSLGTLLGTLQISMPLKQLHKQPLFELHDSQANQVPSLESLPFLIFLHHLQP